MSTATPPASLRGAHTHHHLRGGHGRLGRRLLLHFVIALALVIGLGALGAIVAKPSEHLCKPYQPCGPARVVRPLVNETVWRSARFGYTLEYPANEAGIAQQGSAGLVLQSHLPDGNTGTILIHGFAGASPAQAIHDQLSTLTGVTQLATDTLPADQLLGGGVGYRAGAGQVFTGYLAAPQGVGNQVSLATQAATSGGVTISVTVAGVSSDAGPSSFLYQLGDQIVNSIRWPGRP